MAEHIGARIKYWRMRRGGMTQAALAGLAGVSQSYVSQIESGLKGIDRRSTLIDFARALQVSVADLLGQPGDPTNPLAADAAAAVPAIRLALVEIEEGERRQRTRSTDELAAAVDHLAALRVGSEYTLMAQALPSLLSDAAATGGVTLARVAYEAQVCLHCLGYRDFALSAARIAVGAAEDAEDDAWIGAARFAHTLAMPVEAASTSRRIAVQTLSDLQAKAADPNVRQMLGQLHLSASMWSAVEGRASDSVDHLVAAQAEAQTLGDPEDGIGFNLLGFGPTNVRLWQMNVAVENADHGKAIELAESFRPTALRAVDRHQAYWLAYARALATSGRNDQAALAAYLNAERAAPTPFAVNTKARDAVQAMVYRAKRRAVSGELRTLARRLGIEVA
jgi:transcriptional regulator with XRE-family HTH domain